MFTSPCICFQMSGVTTPRISVRGVPSTIFSKAQTERTVEPPKMPSIGPGSKLSAASADCRASTSEPTIPWVRSLVSSETVVNVVGGAAAAGSGSVGGLVVGDVVLVKEPVEELRSSFGVCADEYDA